MEMPSSEQAPEEKKISEPEKKKPGLLGKAKNFIALGAALTALNSEPVSIEAQGADRSYRPRTSERVAHPNRQSVEKTIETPLGPLTYTNPLDALLTRVPYHPKVIKKTYSFSADISGHNAKIEGKVRAGQSSRVVHPGSQSRKFKK